jgi:transcriptional regulator with XRE-family HTH domain
MPTFTESEIVVISKYFKETRVKLKLTQEQFARLIGVTQSQVNKYEHKKSMPPTHIYLRVVAADPDLKKKTE